MSFGKIGFCCKWIDTSGVSPKAAKAITEKMNQKTTTQKHLRSLAKIEQFDKIKALVEHNTDTLWRQLKWLAQQPKNQRLFRITSEFLPLRTVKEFQWIYGHYSLEELIIERLRGVRRYADENQIRLCMHPGQFTNLCSTDANVVKASIEDFEYHVDLARLMGYGDTWHSSGFAINIHANKRQDPGLKNIRRIINNDLSLEGMNLITLENDEYGCGVMDYIDAGVHEDVALVLDYHHHWINSNGFRILPTFSGQIPLSQVERAFWDSWRGKRPLAHYSQPSEEIIEKVGPLSANQKPAFGHLIQTKGVTGKDLRKHSYTMWDTVGLTDLMYHLQFFDIEIEAKGKNVASQAVYDYAVQHGYIT